MAKKRVDAARRKPARPDGAPHPGPSPAGGDAPGQRPWSAAAYVPVPGIQLVPVLVHPGSRLVRFHAWQAGVVTLLFLGGLMVIGFLMQALPEAASDAMGYVAAAWLVAGVSALAAGAVSAARGRFLRVPVAFHLVAAAGSLRASSARRNA